MKLFTFKVTMCAAALAGAMPAACADDAHPAGAEPPRAQTLSFEREVMPLLERRCNKCHCREDARGGLDLTRLETLRRGGDSLGAAIVSGKPDESPLIQVLTGAKEPSMPEDGEPLATAEVELLRRWVTEGAKDDTPRFTANDVTFFEREVRPILAKRCFKCHAGEDPEHGLRLTSRQGILSGGNRGPAAIAGQPSESLLLKAIRHEGDLAMPRGGDRLSEAQVAAFEEWVARGLPWPGDQMVLARERQFAVTEADRNHWAFRPLAKDLPSDWGIDGALAKHHAERGLSPSEEADKHRLLRRVTYDLIGYPPTTDEIAGFVADTSPHAFEKVVDRLLASPHFGWRWGRHWIDYTRNGSTGQPTRGPALDAQRYEAWVARCFNEDRPWDWFARVHLAGDLMPAFEAGDYSIDQALAAAVPLNGPRTFENAETETFILMDKLDEGIEFLGRSLLGISLECARCHDHKYDPISQRDYYALLGIFQSSGFAPVPLAAQSRTAAVAAIEKLDELMREKTRLEGLLNSAAQRLNVQGGGLIAKWKTSRHEGVTAKDKRLRELEIEIVRAELNEAESHGKKSLADDIRGVITNLDVKLQNYQPPAANFLFGYYNYFINGHKSQIGLMKRAKRLGLVAVVHELDEQNRYWDDESRLWQEHTRFGGFEKTDREVAELAQLDDRIREIESELPANIVRRWEQPISTHLYVRCDGGLRRAEDLKSYDLSALAQGIKFNSNSPSRALIAPRFIGDARLLLRGDVQRAEKRVPRGFPVFFGETQPILEGSGRLQLAEWLTKPDSIQAALVARTAVNRAWQHLFGEALCRSPKELGRLGDQPEMPGLIDGLSSRFIDNGWSIKKLVREIVLSCAYRRSSVASDEEFARDPDNRYFARQSVRRLEYEPITSTLAWLRAGARFDLPQKRDAALPAVGDIARHFDGPAVYDLIDRRVVSITATQALYLMNNANAAHGVAADLVQRLGFTEKTTIAEALPGLYTAILQRAPTVSEYKLAAQFLNRRRQQTGQVQPIEELREFASLLLCGNEILYIE